MIDSILQIIDWVFFIPTAITILYMLFYAIAGMKYEAVWNTNRSKKQARFLIITTACEYDTSVEKTVKSVMAQDYDEENFDMIVVGDNLPTLMNMKLIQYPITFMRTKFENGSKLKALQYAVQNMSPLKIYDIVVLIDPDETIGTQFLQKINRSYQIGYRMMQAHRTDFDRQTSSMIFATTFEEINNSIFRIGHNNMGFSSALIGSGFCADFNWFRENIFKLSSQYEEKEMEILLLQQRMYVDFVGDAFIYVDHIKSTRDFNSQRRRWIVAQAKSLRHNIKHFIPALFRGNYDLADKIFQWMLVPRILLVSIITIMSLVSPLFSWAAAVKWWMSALVFLLACAFATPDYLVDDSWVKAYRQVPFLLLDCLSIPFRAPVYLFRSIFQKKKA